MRLHEIMETTAGGTGAGGIAGVAMPMGMQRRGGLINEKPKNPKKRKKTNVSRRFENSIGN
jgi:hypothetical protein